MTEQGFLKQWLIEKPMYDAWGSLVVSSICEQLASTGNNLDSYLKLPAKHRVKGDESLIDKAFYRPNKNYEEPYDDIEDKVGSRFVVLLVDQIDQITKIIEESTLWTNEQCRDFAKEREDSPLLFTYQSVHYIVRARIDCKHKGVLIKRNTPCEIQIRTLLQHAYAELTHDAIYKSKKLVEPKVHRTIAKSMALIETTDDFFSDVNRTLNSGVADSSQIQSELDNIYTEYIDISPSISQKSSLVILDEFECLIEENLPSKLRIFMNKESYLIDAIKRNEAEHRFYRQSIIIFVYWLIKRKKNRLLENWPLDRKIIERLAIDLGISLAQA